MNEKVFAVLGLFETPDALRAAIPKLRQADLGELEAYTPYPVHGIDRLLGHRRSPLGGMVLVMGVLGTLTALAFQYWISAVDYPIVTGGKAPYSWQAFVPIMFEVMVLFATFTAGLGMLLFLNRLPFFSHPVLASPAMASITRDRFALAVESAKGLLDIEAARKAMLEAGAVSVEVVPAPEPAGPLSISFLKRSVAGILIACAVSGFAMYWGVKLFPVLPPMIHMEEQPKLNPQKPSDFFRDGHGMQRPAPGAVARGYMPYTLASPEEAAPLVSPLPMTSPILALGRIAYNDRCAVCHGAVGNGVPTLTAAYGAKPVSLHSQAIREAPDGTIYHAIARGKNSMPTYAADLTVEERWAVVNYVRVLQRAQNAKPEDVPE